MRGDFVTYEQAIKLKELGFDWKCMAYYFMDSKEFRDNIKPDNHNCRSEIVASAPTLAQAQKWLRETKGVIVCATPRFYKNKRPLIGYDYHLFDDDGGWYSYIEAETVYDTYEEALSVGIDRALEFFKQH